jgi:preprotein translocase subunit SecE
LVEQRSPKPQVAGSIPVSPAAIGFLPKEFNKMGKLKNLWMVTYDELVNKVTWPSWDDLVQSTVIVLVASIIFALAIYILDKGFDFVTNFLYKLI